MARDSAWNIQLWIGLVIALLRPGVGLAQGAESHLVSPAPPHLVSVAFRIQPSAPDDITRLEFRIRVRNSGHQASERGLSLLIDCAPIGVSRCPRGAPFGSTLPAIPSGATQSVTVSAEPFPPGAYRLTAETDVLHHLGSASALLHVRSRSRKTARAADSSPIPPGWTRAGNELLPQRPGAELMTRNGIRVRALSAPPATVRFVRSRQLADGHFSAPTPLPERTRIVDSPDGMISAVQDGRRVVLGKLALAGRSPADGDSPETR